MRNVGHSATNSSLIMPGDTTASGSRRGALVVEHAAHLADDLGTAEAEHHRPDAVLRGLADRLGVGAREEERRVGELDRSRHDGVGRAVRRVLDRQEVGVPLDGVLAPAVTDEA